jgi:hypothetical protein
MYGAIASPIPVRIGRFLAGFCTHDVSAMEFIAA